MAPGAAAWSTARVPWQADDIDGVAWLDRELPAGALVDVEVTEVIDDYDFRARVVGAPDLAPAPAPADFRRARQLPLASIGSFGR